MAENYHGSNYVITQISITTGGLGGSLQPTSGQDAFWSIHGIGQLIAWNIFVFIGYIAARFLRHYPWWSYLHFLGGTIPSWFTIGVAIAAIIKGMPRLFHFF